MEERPALIFTPTKGGLKVFRRFKGETRLVSLFAAEPVALDDQEAFTGKPTGKKLAGYLLEGDLVYDVLVMLAEHARLDVTKVNEGIEDQEDREKLKKIEDAHYNEGLESLCPFTLIRDRLADTEAEEEEEPEPDTNQETLSLGT